MSLADQILTNLGRVCWFLEWPGMVYGGAVSSWAALMAHRSIEAGRTAYKTYAYIAVIAAAIGPGAWFSWNVIIARGTGYKLFPLSHWVVWGLSIAVGILCGLLWLRWVVPTFDVLGSKVSKRTTLERNSKSDVREIGKFLPANQIEFDPSIFFRLGATFLGLSENKQPIYFNGRLPHMCVIGTSGSGKGVALQSISAQCLRAGEVVVYMDPKNDEWGPHSLRHEAERANVPYTYVDLRANAAQLNLFHECSPEQIEELLVAGFALGDKGGEGDFYRVADRQAAKLAAEIAAGLSSPTPNAIFEQVSDETVKAAPYFWGLMREMAQTTSVNAVNGISLRQLVKNGGCLYVVGSMRFERVKRLQRMLFVRLIQIAEERDRSVDPGRPICLILDEFKYSISRSSIEGFGAARDKGIHIIAAFQSFGDLQDCPQDLSAEAVIGSVVENCKLKICYRVMHPDTAEWLARMSGKIQVDNEVRMVRKNLALSEELRSERHISQTERYLIDENMMLNMPEGTAVIFGNGLPSFVRISPIQVKRTQEAVTTTDYGRCSRSSLDCLI